MRTASSRRRRPGVTAAGIGAASTVWLGGCTSAGARPTACPHLDPALTSAHDEEFEAFVRLHRSAMVRTAGSLSVGDGHLAEDVVQRALIKLYLAWPRVRTMNVEAYARRVLVNAFIDERRRPTAQRERAMPNIPDGPSSSDEGERLDPDLLAALRTLPRGMRSIVVLRYVENLSVEQTADISNCSPGNVKSQSARGLAKLRVALSELVDRGSDDTSLGSVIRTHLT